MHITRPRAGARVCAAAAALVACLAFVPSASARFFSSKSFWNTPLSKAAPLDARSGVWTQHVLDKIALNGTWINTTSYSVPIYTVPAGQPLVKVTLDEGATYQSEFNSVPVPPDMVPPQGDDRHVAIYQPSTDTLWELLATYKSAVDGT